jgi:hypothetical protein
MCGQPRAEGYGRIELRRTVGLVSATDHKTPADYDYPALRNPDLQWVLKEGSNGWILRTSPTDNGLWFDTKESALRWADGMGVNETTIQIVPRA